jgi:DNA-binding NarL/FixJ family response regulator
VVQLVSEGKSNNEAAQVLDVAVNTPQSQRTYVMEKLDLHGTAELLQCAVSKGIIQW